MGDNEFGLEKQKLLIEYMLIDESIFQRCHNILKPQYFDKELQNVVSYMLKHANEYNQLPTTKQILAETNVNFVITEQIREQDHEWALRNIEKFCQRGAIVQAVWKAPDFIEKGDYGAVEALVKDAVVVGLQKDLGTDYFANPRERLEKIRTRNLIPTGWLEVDKKLYGGLNRGEITIFAGGSGAGKSLFLQNICLNWAEGSKYTWDGKTTYHKPLNVVYITLELSEQLTSKRIDTMVTGIDARDIFKKIDDVELKVRMKAKNSGHLRIKYLPAGSTVNDIKAYLKEFEIQTGIRPDAIAVDYLDLLHPIRSKVNISDLFLKDKYVTEELRALAGELDIICVTASQLNRCLSLDTIVEEKNKGIIRIKDVVVGDQLKTNTGYNTVTHRWPVTKQSVYKIKTKSGKEIICSSKHIFPTNNGEKSLESGLKIGDKLALDNKKI